MELMVRKNWFSNLPRICYACGRARGRFPTESDGSTCRFKSGNLIVKNYGHGEVVDSSAHTDLTHLYTHVMSLICAHRFDSSVHTTCFCPCSKGLWSGLLRYILYPCPHLHRELGLKPAFTQTDVAPFLDSGLKDRSMSVDANLI